MIHDLPQPFLSASLTALAVRFAIGIKLVSVVGIWFCQSHFWLNPFPPINRAVGKTPALPVCRIVGILKLRYGCFFRLLCSCFSQVVSILTTRIIDHSLCGCRKLHRGLARKIHSGVEQRSGERVRRLEIIEPNEHINHRFFNDRL